MPIQHDAELISRYRKLLQEGRQTNRGAYLAGASPAKFLREAARLVDKLLKGLWGDLAIAPSLSLVAVGGYGRGELYPASDVDLLILLPTPDCLPAIRPALERMIGLLWDIGLEIGHSVRTIDECIIEASKDITIQTALLESRPIAGNLKLFRQLESRFHEALDPLTFFKAKRLEQEERYAKHNDTPYNLEPNCKENPGGLRDLQIIVWIMRASGLARDWRELARTSLVSSVEARLLTQTESFLRRVRIGLHLLTGRREDRLLFDHHEALARALGFEPSPERRASEVLMQNYYRNAKQVTQLNTLVLLDLASRIEDRPAAASIDIDADFQMSHGFLDIRSANVFENKPETLLRSFLLLSQRQELKGMTPRSLRAMWNSRKRIDAEFRRNPVNRNCFLALFKEKRGLTHQLRTMNQFDILGAYLPAFGDIVGRMQHDLFHVYTVDQHIMQVVRNLRRLSLPEFAHEFPYCSRLMAGFPDRWRLYVAALFHDIAKGRGGDHSRLGKVDAAQFCIDHGIQGRDATLITFLVEHHLTMSSYAQKQDLSDPETILRFAGIVGSEECLTALYLLTVCDIRGTSPKVWNGWKAKLLEDLYRMTSRILRGEAVAPLAGIEERMEDARRLLRLRGLRPGTEANFWQQLDTAYFLRHDSEEISWHTLTLYYRVDSPAPIVRTRINPAGAGLQIMIFTADQSELFARICGFITRLGFSIVDAKIHTTRHGYALDSFAVLDPGNDLPLRDMIGLIDHDLAEHLQNSPPLPPPQKGRLSRQARHVQFSPEVSIRRSENNQGYILSITAADRTGLLFSIASILARHDVKLSTAKIATLGERVEDTFLINGAELAQTATLIRLEQELLEALQV